MTKITTIGLDLAKKVFQVHGVDAEGKVIVARQLRRKQVLAFFAKLPPCLVGMEACGSAYYWAREIEKLGHTVRLMPPKYVKAYVKRGKTDAGDAAAICEAVSRPSMTFVPIKSIGQQGLSMLHSVRSKLVSQRTQLVNAVRGHLSELGIVAERGLLGLAELAAVVRDKTDERLPVAARAALLVMVNQIEMVGAEIAKLDTAMRARRTRPTISAVGSRLSPPLVRSSPVPSGRGSRSLSCLRTVDIWRHGSESYRKTIRRAASQSRRGSPKRVIDICVHCSSAARWPLCARPRCARKGIRGSPTCSPACPPSRLRSRSPTRTRALPGSLWCAAGSTKPAIALLFIAAQRCLCLRWRKWPRLCQKNATTGQRLSP